MSAGNDPHVVHGVPGQEAAVHGASAGGRHDHQDDPQHAHHGGGDHGGHADDGGFHISRSGYLTGFVLSVILTAIPFWLVMSHVISSSAGTAFAILAIGAVQIVVHMIYFLHMNTTIEQGWSLMALIFTVVFVVITLAGSMWVMHHMNTNMMPTSPAEMRHRP